MLASSPTGLAESGSLSLRTGHSPQVAPHPFSRKRNYHCWIQAGNGDLEGTYTLLFKRLHRRTSHHRSRVMWLRREPNNRSKPPISLSISVNPREHSGKTRPFAVRIKPDFSDEFSVRIYQRERIGICWTRTRNDHHPVIEPHDAER
jgi:hypothetical protein